MGVHLPIANCFLSPRTKCILMFPAVRQGNISRARRWYDPENRLYYVYLTDFIYFLRVKRGKNSEPQEDFLGQKSRI